MPFDNPKEQLKVRVRNRQEVALIDKMLTLLRTPSNWCKDTPEIHGRYCLIGAWTKADSGDARALSCMASPAAVRVWTQLKILSLRVGEIDPVALNDKQGTRHRDIVSLLVRARASFE